jgi:hypothetical protein
MKHTNYSLMNPRKLNMTMSGNDDLAEAEAVEDLVDLEDLTGLNDSILDDE